MAKAGVLLVGTDDGVVLFSDPGGGGRWLRVGRELRGQAVPTVWLDYAAPLRALALVAGAGLLRSDDGGRAWQPALAEPVLALAGGDRHAPGRAVALLGGGALLASEDGGASWQPLAAQGLPAPLGQPRLVLAGGDCLLLGQGDGVWSSADMGRTWVRCGAGPGDVAGLAVTPDQPGGLYAVAGGQLWRSSDAGAVWSVGGAPPASGALAALPGQPPALLLAAEAGLQRSEDGGASWQPVADLPEAGPVSAVAPARYNVDVVFAGSAGGALSLSTDRGRHWQVIRADLAAVRAISAARLA